MIYKKTLLASLGLVLWLMTMASEARSQLPTPAGTPTVTITNVKNLGSQGSGGGQKQTSVEVDWTASAPPQTTFSGFDVSVEITFADNSKSSSTAQAGAASTTAQLQVTSQASSGGAKSFVASVTAHFSSSATQTATKKFIRPRDSKTGQLVPINEGKQNPALGLLTVRSVEDTSNCREHLPCANVSLKATWSISFASLSGFQVAVNVGFTNGFPGSTTQVEKTDSKSVGGADREVTFTLPRPDEAKIVNAVTVNVTAIFTPTTGTVVAPKSGNF